MSEPKKKRRGHEEEEHGGGHERWMISYADMLTLLLALFIVMFAISKVDQAKFIEFAQGANTAFGGAGNLAVQGKTGINSGTDGIATGVKPPDNTQAVVAPADGVMKAGQAALQQQAAAKQEQANLQKLRDQIRAELAEKGLTDMVQMHVDERGLVINIITDRVLFDVGQATLRPDGAKVLDLIAPSVQRLPHRIAIEGHTDNVPIRTAQFPSNWELSQARASSVLQRMITDGLEPTRLNLSAYGEYKPIDTNSTEVGKARNRRVAIVVLAAQNSPQTPIASPSPVATSAP